MFHAYLANQRTIHEHVHVYVIIIIIVNNSPKSGVPEVYKLSLPFSKVLLTSADLKKHGVKKIMVKHGYVVQELVAKVKDAVANS